MEYERMDRVSRGGRVKKRLCGKQDVVLSLELTKRGRGPPSWLSAKTDICGCWGGQERHGD